MAGYSGYSKSNNAVAAEQNGMLPLSRITGATRWAIKLAGELVGPEEWHHTSKHYNETDYYDVARIMAAANSLVQQYVTKAQADESIKAKREGRAKASIRRTARNIAYTLPCVVWTRGESGPQRSTNLDHREFIRLMRARGLPMTLAARNQLAMELADAREAFLAQ